MEHPPNTEEIAARLVVEIVTERALPAVFKEDSDQARPAGNHRRHHLHYSTLTPLFLGFVKDPFSHTEVEALVHVRGSSLVSSSRPARQTRTTKKHLTIAQHPEKRSGFA